MVIEKMNAVATKIESMTTSEARAHVRTLFLDSINRDAQIRAPEELQPGLGAFCREIIPGIVRGQNIGFLQRVDRRHYAKSPMSVRRHRLRHKASSVRFSRDPAATALLINLLAVFFLVHHAAFFSSGHVELVLVYIAAFAAVLLCGPGKFSLDARLRK